MLDLRFVRTHPDLVRAGLDKRRADDSVLDELWPRMSGGGRCWWRWSP